MNNLEILFRVKRKLEAWYGNSMGDLKVLIQDYSPAETRIEKDRYGVEQTYHYPETVEVKFENQSNSFYSFRVSDGRFIREGRDLVANPGLTAVQLYRIQATEARERRAMLNKSRSLKAVPRE